MTLLLHCGCDRTEYTRRVGWKIAEELLQIGRPGMASLFNVSLRPPESTDHEISEAPGRPGRGIRRFLSIRLSATAGWGWWTIRWGKLLLPSPAEEVLRKFFNEMSTFMINQSESGIS